MMKKNSILLFLCFCFVNVFAQDPNWSVNASDYQYSMTFTAFLNVDGTTLSSSEDKVAAFVNDEIRGVASVVKHTSSNKYVVYLTVFANTNSETLKFKIFDSSKQKTVEVTDTYDFSIDGNVGGIFQSYSIASPALSDKAILNSFSLSGITSVSQSIEGDKINIVLPANTDVTNLKAVFSVSDGSRFYVDKIAQNSGVSIQNFTNKVTYGLLSQNEVTFKEYEVSVTVEEAAGHPPSVELITTNVDGYVKVAPIVIDMKTSVAISGFELEDVILTNAIITNITKDNDLLYKLKIVPIQQGAFSIEIPEGKFVNSLNDGNSASNKLSFVYDLENPYLVSIKRKNPTDEITDNDVLEFTVIFNEAVKNVLATSFESISDATFTFVKETDSKYTVTIKNMDYYHGVVSLNIKSSNTIQDKAGNLLINSVFNAQQN